MKIEIIEPIKSRSPYFDGWDTNKAAFLYSCNDCKADLKVLFTDILEAAWGWKYEDNKEQINIIADIFEIDLTNKSIENGMNAIIINECHNCKSIQVINLILDEYRNSCYKISLRSIGILIA